MIGIADETVGEKFSDELLEAARDKTLTVIREAASMMKPGMTELQAKALITEIQTKLGASRTWHPAQVRFGINTVLPFGIPGKEGVVLQENDIFFFDIGPVFNDLEGDVGRPFIIGHNPDYEKCCKDAEKIWHMVREHWQKTNLSGEQLYRFAEEAAHSNGWLLSLQKANGHRIADFPHAARSRGAIQTFPDKPAPNRWILEIQIRHPRETYGAFYEDLLN